MDFILKNDRDKIIKHLSRKLDKERFKHSISVSYIASSLAMVHGEDINKAMTAGLLHDYAKNMSIEEQLEYCEKHRIELTDYEINNPCVIHGKVGALKVMKKYKIKDEDVIGAIYNHVMGKKNMTKLEKIVFIADYIEPQRDELPNIENIRKNAFLNLDITMAMIYKNIINYIEAKGNKIDSATIEAYEYYNGGKID